MKILLNEIISFFDISYEQISNSKDSNIEDKIFTTLSTLHILIDNCPDVISFDQKKIALTLLKMNQVENIKLRMHLAYCWNSLIRFNKEIFFEIPDHLFTFFVLNFNYNDHELNFSSAEFFHYIIDEAEKNPTFDKLEKLMEARIHE